MVGKCPAAQTYKLSELAEAAQTSPRTIRYYVQRGLLEAPSFRGKDTEYTEVHLAALRAIFALQKAYLPLGEIATRLRDLSIEELVALGEGGPVPAPIPIPILIPTRQPSPIVAPHGPARWVRAEIAPGLEVSLREDAAHEVVELFERLMRQATSIKGAKE